MSFHIPSHLSNSPSGVVSTPVLANRACPLGIHHLERSPVFYSCPSLQPFTFSHILAASVTSNHPPLTLAVPEEEGDE